MRTIDEVIQEVEVDSKIPTVDLEVEIFRTPQLLAKYMKWHYEYKTTIARYDTMLQQLIKTRANYYNGNGTAAEYRDEPFNDVISNQKQMDRYLEADVKICDLKEKIVALESIRDMIGTMVDNLKYRNNHLRTIMELRVFEKG